MSRQPQGLLINRPMNLEIQRIAQAPTALRQPRRLLTMPVDLMLVCLLGIGLNARADEEQDQIAILQSTAGLTQKSAACQRLRVIGTPKSIPALASLLTEEGASHFARHALEGLPFPEAGAALRAALEKTSDKPHLQAGMIDSIGWRRDSESIELLTPLLASTNLDLAITAASALGRIGGAAVAPLRSANDQAQDAPVSMGFRSVVQESLLQCAETLLDADGTKLASEICRGVFSQPASESIRVAAWRGLVLRDAQSAPDLVRTALSGRDRSLHRAALGLVRELDDASILAACLGDWNDLHPESQIALLDASVQGGKEPLPIVRKALGSSNLALRVAALDALADLADPSSIPSVARIAARGEPSEREAAARTLARIRGPGVRETLRAAVETADTVEKAALLRALGARGDRQAGDTLLRFASAEAQPVRLAALESLRQLALPETLAPLLDLAAKARSEDQIAPVFKALVAVCQSSPNTAETEGRVIAAIRNSAPAERRLLLPLLAELGTADALTAVRNAAQDTDSELVRTAVRVLGQWPNAGPAPYLIGFAQSATDPGSHALALRGAVEVSAHEPDASKRVALLEKAMSVARRADEKRLALAQTAQLGSAGALETALKNLADPDLAEEAGLAAIAIAEKLAAADSALADAAAVKVLARCKAADTVRRAWALRRTPAISGPFIQHWLVSGPYRQAGVEGAAAVLELAFAPEKADPKADWKPAPTADQVDLSGLFPGQASCVAYLRAEIVAEQDSDALLLMGSDDGLKVWLNGAVVHSNNVDRGLIVDQDRAPIKLRRGANRLLLKVSQGGGGWAACARIAGTDGQRVPGLRIEPAQP